MIERIEAMKHLLTILLIGFGLSASAQKTAIKTNVIYDATASLNIGIEYAWDEQWSAELSGVKITTLQHLNAGYLTDSLKTQHQYGLLVPIENVKRLERALGK